MPLGPEPLGIVYFAGVKLAGYSLFGRYLRQKYTVDHPAPLTFGIARTALGLAVGIGFASLLAHLNVPHTTVAFYVLLLPVRFGEWLLTIWLFFSRRTLLARPGLARQAVLGSAYSYLLDVPAVISVFVLPRGAWIC